MVFRKHDVIELRLSKDIAKRRNTQYLEIY
jgi:hypothetical protein